MTGPSPNSEAVAMSRNMPRNRLRMVVETTTRSPENSPTSPARRAAPGLAVNGFGIDGEGSSAAMVGILPEKSGPDRDVGWALPTTAHQRPSTIHHFFRSPASPTTPRQPAI